MSIYIYIYVCAHLWGNTCMHKTRTKKMAYQQEVEGGSGGNDCGMGNKVRGVKGRDFFDYTLYNSDF